MSEDLKTIFTNVNDWLKYAETKNGTLTAFNGAVIFGLLQAWGFLSHAMITIDVMLLTTSSLLSISSFIPKLSTVLKETKIRPEDWDAKKRTVNLLYFGDISRLTKAQFIQLFDESARPESDYQLTLLDGYLIDQILINAEIALNKNKWFGKAVRLAIATIVLNLLYIIHLIMNSLNFC